MAHSCGAGLYRICVVCFFFFCFLFFAFCLKTKRPRDQHFFARTQDPRCVYVAWSRAFENPLPAR